MATVDNIFILIMFLGFALAGLIGIFIFDNTTTSFMNEQLWDKSAAGSKIREDVRTVYDNMDTVLVMIWIGLHLSLIILVFFLKTHPVVLVGSIFLSVVLVLVAAPLSNAWETIIANGNFVSAASQMIKTNFIMDNYPLFEFIWAMLTMVVLIGTGSDEGF